MLNEPTQRAKSTPKIHQLPYQSHDGHELQLMIDGTKPFAMFHDTIFDDTSEDQVDVSFAPHVATGRFLAHEEKMFWDGTSTIGGRCAIGSRIRMYALEKEEWRIRAFLLIQKARGGQPWSDAQERAVSLLLGYSEEQVNAWIGGIHENRCAWGALTTYMFVGEADMALLQQLGFRALHPDLAGPIVLIAYEEGPCRSAIANDMIPEGREKMVRFGINTRFFLASENRIHGNTRVVEFDVSSIPEINQNLKSCIEVCS